jgi:hypothetical protein
LVNSESLKEVIKRELPGWLRDDPALRAYILELTREHYADRAETQDWFHQMLNELRRDREEQARRWDEQLRKWEEDARKWDEQSRQWDEQNRRWEESGQRFDRLHEEIMAQASKFDRSIGALGARWGTQSEKGISRCSGRDP